MKHKKVFIPLIVVGGVVLSLGAFAGGVAINGTHMENHSIDPSLNANWMGRLNDARKLNEIVIPGSHDAGTDTMSWLGRTQCYGVGDQLTQGVRYFDLRTNNTNGTKDGLLIYHSIINGRKFTEVVSEIKGFMEANPSETLLLDFQHFKNDAAQLTYDLITSELGDYILSKPVTSTLSDLEYIDSLTLGDTRGKCVVFWGEEYQMAEDHANLFARNNDTCSKQGMSMDSQYISSYHKGSSEDFIKNALPKYFEDIKTKQSVEGHKGMFVLQCQLTDGSLIFGPWSRERGHNANMSEYLKNIKNDAEKLSLLNIVMRDFLGDGDKVGSIIELNQYK